MKKREGIVGKTISNHEGYKEEKQYEKKNFKKKKSKEDRLILDT